MSPIESRETNLKISRRRFLRILAGVGVTAFLSACGIELSGPGYIPDYDYQELLSQIESGSAYKEDYGNIILVTDPALNEKDRFPIKQIGLNPLFPEAQVVLEEMVYKTHAAVLGLSIDALKEEIQKGSNLSYCRFSFNVSELNTQATPRENLIDPVLPVTIIFSAGADHITYQGGDGLKYATNKQGALSIFVRGVGMDDGDWTDAMATGLLLIASNELDALKRGVARPHPWQPGQLAHSYTERGVRIKGKYTSILKVTS